jgi:F0F1-type ATP synthase assembly protein I
MKQKRNVWVMVGQYSSLAMLLPAATVVGYGIGYLLDNALGTSFLKPVFLILGIAAGFVQLIKQVQKDTSDREQ